MKLRAILLDDEKHSLETTAILIRQFCPDVEIIAELNQPVEAIEIINAEEPDGVLGGQVPGECAPRQAAVRKTRRPRLGTLYDLGV